MRALLMLYMVKYLFEPGRIEGVLGLAAVKTALELVFGRLDPQPLASQLFGFYTGLAYSTPILGGILADRVLGQRRTVIIGGVLMAIGHFLMAFEALFLIALVMLILGIGAFKPNISTQVGALYAPGDPRRDRAYSIFYIGISIGAFLAPLVCGTLAVLFGWHYGFAAAGIGMLASLAIYLCGSHTLPADTLPPAREPAARAPLDPGERRSVLTIIGLCAWVALFWAAYDQQGNTLLLWVEDFTDRSIDLWIWRGQIPSPFFLSLNPLMIFVFAPLLVRMWAVQSRRGNEPLALSKMAFGCFCLALANLLMALAAWTSAGEASPLWLLGYFALSTIGELHLAPVGLALIFKLAPARMVSMMMGIWFATTLPADILASSAGREVEVLVAPLATLQAVLRTQLGQTSVKDGCRQGGCGSCTVLVDGEPVLSCLLPVADVEGRRVTTLEALTPRRASTRSSGRSSTPTASSAATARRAWRCSPRRSSTTTRTRAATRSSTRSRATSAAAPATSRSSDAIAAAAERGPMTADLHVVGQSVERSDGVGFVTGRAAYTADLTFPGMLHLRMVRSPLHHARIRGVDLSEAERVKGYVRALTHEDVPHNVYTILGLIGVEPEEEFVLAVDRVRYMGEPIVAILAETEAAAIEAAAAVRLDLEELPAVFDMEEALAPGAPVVDPLGHEHVHLRGRHEAQGAAGRRRGGVRGGRPRHRARLPHQPDRARPDRDDRLHRGPRGQRPVHRLHQHPGDLLQPRQHLDHPPAPGQPAAVHRAAWSAAGSAARWT